MALPRKLSNALATVFLLMFSEAASARSEGSRAPDGIAPESMSALTCSASLVWRLPVPCVQFPRNRTSLVAPMGSSPSELALDRSRLTRSLLTGQDDDACAPAGRNEMSPTV